MKKVLTLAAGTLTSFALPLVSFAAPLGNITDAANLVIGTINNILVPVLFAIAFIVFLWGAFETFIIGANNEDVKEKGRNLMLWGLIGFFVMVSLWGLVNILTNTVTFTSGNAVTRPPSATGGIPVSSPN